MKEYSTFVGLDVHKKNISVAIAVAGRGEAQYLGEISNDRDSFLKLLKKLKGTGTPLLHFCYEAGPCGYGLYRYTRKLGHDCTVVAPSLIPTKPGERVKTNRRDAQKLARLSRAGELTAVWVPDEKQEALRDLARARDNAKRVEKQAKQVLCAFLNRHGRYFQGKSNWTEAHFDWLALQKFEHVEQQFVLEEYVEAVRKARERVAALDESMRVAFEKWSLRPLGEALMAFRGIDLVTAMGILTELGDLTRFSTPRQLMSYIGCVPSENSSSDDQNRGGITKCGNSKVRRLLVESAWSYRLPPRRTAHWRRKAQHAPEPVREIAWKAMQRLHTRYWRLVNRKGHSGKAIVAVVRELAGFIWAASQQFKPIVLS